MIKDRIARYKRANEIDKYLLEKLNDYYNTTEGLFIEQFGCRIYMMNAVTYNDINIFICLTPFRDFNTATLTNEKDMTIIITEDFMNTHSKLERIQLLDFYMMNFIHQCINEYSLIDAVENGIRFSSVTLFIPLITPSFSRFVNGIIKNRNLERIQQNYKQVEGDGMNGK